MQKQEAMPAPRMFVSRDGGEVYVNTTKGHNFIVTDEPSPVPYICEDDAYAAGCIAVEDIERYGKTDKRVIPAKSGDLDRRSKIIDAMNEMLDSTENGMITTAGVPNKVQLEKLLGFKPTKAEFEDCWEEVSGNL